MGCIQREIVETWEDLTNMEFTLDTLSLPGMMTKHNLIHIWEIRLSLAAHDVFPFHLCEWEVF